MSGRRVLLEVMVFKDLPGKYQLLMHFGEVAKNKEDYRFIIQHFSGTLLIRKAIAIARKSRRDMLLKRPE